MLGSVEYGQRGRMVTTDKTWERVLNLKLCPFFDSNLKGQIAVQSILVLVFVVFKEAKFPLEMWISFSAFYAVCIRKNLSLLPHPFWFMSCFLSSLRNCLLKGCILSFQFNVPEEYRSTD